MFSRPAGSGGEKVKYAGAERHLPWIEKYRPAKVEEVAHQDEIVRILRKSIHEGNMPHLLFYGPPGTGKTSSILALAKELFGPQVYRSRVLELNASDERGIAVVREKVKRFAQVLVRGRPAGSEGFPCPPFKIIILDEADSMTSDAQAALRRVMENYTRMTRFCIICNYISRIIEPLASRCAKFRFQPVGEDAHRGRLQLIANSEGLTVSPDGMESLLSISGGDLRRSITLMQSASNLYDKSVDQKAVLEVAGQAPDSIVLGLFAACQQSSKQVENFVNDITAEGYTCSQILIQLLQGVMTHPELDDETKADLLVDTLGPADHALTNGADEYLQLLNVSFSLLKAFRKKQT